MKNKFKILEGLKNKNYFTAWVIFHILIAAFFLIRFAVNRGEMGIIADLMNITPRNIDSEPISMADEKLSAITGNNAFILVANPDFESAKACAESVYGQLNGSEYFTSVSLYNDIESYSDVQDFLFRYRWNMLDEKSIELINSENGVETFGQNAAAKAYGLFTMTSLDNLEDDPFMLTENSLTNYLMALQNSGTAMSVKDGMLCSQQDEIWYIMIRCVLSKKGSAMATKNNGVNQIYSVCSPLEKDGTEFIFSGTPYHSNESSAAASKEITIISVVSLLAVLVMLIVVFRTPLPILCSFGSIIVSVITAFLFTMAVFSRVMILTLVFGTSLIGSCIDYSLHYFTQWAGNSELKTSAEIRKHLVSGLGMAIVSTGICYAILLFAPFPLLKQISLFSLVGLFSSFLTTICVYPTIPLPSGDRKLKIKSLYRTRKSGRAKKIVGRILVAAMFVFAIAVIIFNKKNVGIENDISRLYTMEGRLLEDEMRAAKIIQYSPTGWFIVGGDSEDDVLSNEENLRKTLESQKDPLKKYLSTTLFVPSIATQKKSREACRKLLENCEQQYELLGMDSGYADTLRQEFDDSEGDYISFSENSIPRNLMESISTVHLGEINGRFYTVLMPNLTLDEKTFSSIADLDDNVFFISKRSDISSSLDSLTKMVMKFFAVAYLIMFVVLKIFYPWKQTLKIISVPLLITLLTSAVFSLTKTKLEFFSVTGLILVFGLGLDYIIYMVENEKNRGLSTNRLEPFATALSFGTTLISFGALAFSSFLPVHLIGLAISIGLTTAFVCSNLYDRT